MTDEPKSDFEDALRRLERVVDDLERGELGLSDALVKYEEGVRLLTHCQGVLDGAERSVALLTGVDAAGEAVTAPFDASATGEDAPASTRKRPRNPDPAPAPDPAPRDDDRSAPF